MSVLPPSGPGKMKLDFNGYVTLAWEADSQEVNKIAEALSPYLDDHFTNTSPLTTIRTGGVTHIGVIKQITFTPESELRLEASLPRVPEVSRTNIPQPLYKGAIGGDVEESQNDRADRVSREAHGWLKQHGPEESESGALPETKEEKAEHLGQMMEERNQYGRR